MKPDKPPTPSSTRDRDILRARNTRSLKATTQTTSSMSVSLSASEPSADTEPTATVSSDDITASTSSSSQSPSSSSSNNEKNSGGEMKVYLDKLRELVPYVPRSGRISRVQLIHSAIDYITDLQESLEARARRKLRDKQDQSSRPPLAALSQAHVETNNRMTPLAENSSNRQPTLLETNTRHPSALAALSSLSPEEGNTMNNTNLSSTNNIHNSAGSSSMPLAPAAPGPPSPLDPS